MTNLKTKLENAVNKTMPVVITGEHYTDPVELELNPGDYLHVLFDNAEINYLSEVSEPLISVRGGVVDFRGRCHVDCSNGIFVESRQSNTAFEFINSRRLILDGLSARYGDSVVTTTGCLDVEMRHIVGVDMSDCCIYASGNINPDLDLAISYEVHDSCAFNCNVGFTVKRNLSGVVFNRTVADECRVSYATFPTGDVPIAGQNVKFNHVVSRNPETRHFDIRGNGNMLINPEMIGVGAWNTHIMLHDSSDNVFAGMSFSEIDDVIREIGLCERNLIC